MSAGVINIKNVDEFIEAMKKYNISKLAIATLKSYASASVPDLEKTFDELVEILARHGISEGEITKEGVWIDDVAGLINRIRINKSEDGKSN